MDHRSSRSCALVHSCALMEELTQSNKATAQKMGFDKGKLLTTGRFIAFKCRVFLYISIQTVPMAGAAEFYRKCKQEIKRVLANIEEGSEGVSLLDVKEALVAADQLPPSTEGLDGWRNQLEAEKRRLEELGGQEEAEWSNAFGAFELALSQGDCEAASQALENLKSLQLWQLRQDGDWNRRLEECQKRGPQLSQLRHDAQLARQNLDDTMMLDCINRAESLGENLLVQELHAGHKEIGQTKKVLAGLEKELTGHLKTEDWSNVLDKANRILNLVPTNKLALDAKRKAERVTKKDDFPKKLIELAEEAEFAKRPKMALRYYEWAKEEARNANELVEEKIVELRAVVSNIKTSSKTVIFVGPPSAGKTVMLGSFLYFLQTRKESDVQDIGTDDASARLRSSLQRDFAMGEFPDSTAALAQGFEHQIPEIRVKVEPDESSKSLRPIELTLLDIAGEHFRAFDATKEKSVDLRVQNYLRSSPEDLIFVFVIPANLHGSKKDQVDLEMLMTDFGLALSTRNNLKEYCRLLAFSKWDLYTGDALRSDELLRHYPMLQSISPDDSDDILKFKVGRELGEDKFEWDEWSAELFARRIYRASADVDDDPWVIRKKKKWFKF